MNFKNSLTKGDAGVLLIYLFCVVIGAMMLIFGFGYNMTDRYYFGMIAGASIILMAAYAFFCDII